MITDRQYPTHKSPSDIGWAQTGHFIRAIVSNPSPRGGEDSRRWRDAHRRASRLSTYGTLMTGVPALRRFAPLHRYDPDALVGADDDVELARALRVGHPCQRPAGEGGDVEDRAQSGDGDDPGKGHECGFTARALFEERSNSLALDRASLGDQPDDRGVWMFGQDLRGVGRHGRDDARKLGLERGGIVGLGRVGCGEP